MFSKAGVDAALKDHRELIPKLFSMRRRSSTSKTHDAEDVAEPDNALESSPEDERLEEFVGTAPTRASGLVAMTVLR